MSPPPITGDSGDPQEIEGMRSPNTRHCSSTSFVTHDALTSKKLKKALRTRYSTGPPGDPDRYLKISPVCPVQKVKQLEHLGY